MACDRLASDALTFEEWYSFLVRNGEVAELEVLEETHHALQDAHGRVSVAQMQQHVALPAAGGEQAADAGDGAHVPSPAGAGVTGGVPGYQGLLPFFF